MANTLRNNKPETTASRRRKAKEEQMLDDLENIFLRHGFRRITVEYLASELHCSKRSLYELAPNKEALFLRVLDRYLSRLREEGNQNVKGAAPIDAFVKYLQPAVNAARKLSGALIDDLMNFEPARELWETHRDIRMKGLKRLIDLCVEQGIFRQSHSLLVAEVFAASLQFICDPRFLSRANLTYPDAVAELYQLLLNGLLNSDSGDDVDTLQQVTIQLQAKGSEGRKKLLRQLEIITEHLEADSGTATTDGSSCDISVEVTTGKTKTLHLKSENSG